jgi:hypothetical protein
MVWPRVMIIRGFYCKKIFNWDEMGHTIDAHMGEGGGGGKVLKFGHKNAIKH